MSAIDPQRTFVPIAIRAFLYGLNVHPTGARARCVEPPRCSERVLVVETVNIEVKGAMTQGNRPSLNTAVFIVILLMIRRTSVEKTGHAAMACPVCLTACSRYRAGR
jgi:hypothetical protein